MISCSGSESDGQDKKGKEEREQDQQMNKSEFRRVFFESFVQVKREVDSFYENKYFAQFSSEKFVGPSPFTQKI